MGIPLLEGRDFSDRDTATAPKVVLINQSMARTFWPKESPVGKGIKFGPADGQSSPSYTIVGVMGDTREINLDEKPEPELYLPLTSGASGPPFLWPRQLVIRTQGDPLGKADAVRRVVRTVDPNQPISSLRTMDDVIDQEFTSRNTQLILICALAALALLLASAGLYGVLSYTVAQMAPEIGVRMAIGAQPGQAIAMVMRRMLVWVGSGIVMGLVAAGLLARFVKSFLFGVKPMDPLTLAGVVAVMVVVALAASGLPASRAAAVDPIQSLRAE